MFLIEICNYVSAILSVVVCIIVPTVVLDEVSPNPHGWTIMTRSKSLSAVSTNVHKFDSL